MKFLSILTSIIGLYAFYYAALILWDTYVLNRNKEDRSAPEDVFDPTQEANDYNTGSGYSGFDDTIAPATIVRNDGAGRLLGEYNIFNENAISASTLSNRMEVAKQRGGGKATNILDELGADWREASRDDNAA